MQLLDVATGPGSIAAAAHARGARVIGVDLSPGMVELAQRLNPAIEFRQADAEQLPFAEGTFDAVVGGFVVGHLPYPERALRECLRVTKLDGRLAFSWWDDPERHRIQALFREAMADVGARLPPELPAGHSSLRFCSRAAFLELLQGAGLADVEIENHTATHEVASLDALWDGGVSGLVLTSAGIRSQPPETQQRLREAFDRRAAAYQTATGLKLPVAFNVAVGRKLR